ncbi:MAG: PLP-dependent cysteine synthase family protein [Deferrisomatales bacterium]
MEGPPPESREHGVLAAIGNTPLVELTRLGGNPRVRLLAKLEGCNPGGSVKDRPAYTMVRTAEESGELTADRVILEPTSGNTGIALAMIAAVRGYRIRLVMPECVSLERRRILEALGAELTLSVGCQGTDGAIVKAHEILESDPATYYMPNQYANPANWLSHYETTGPEVLSQTRGEVDAFVAGMGTTGTLMGVSRYLKERKPRTRIVAVEPPIGHAIQGLKNMREAIVPAIYEAARLDETLLVRDEEAFEAARQLALREGLFVGMSSGAAVVGALRVASEMASGTVVVLLPDRGDRYLSTALFRSVCADCPP